MTDFLQNLLTASLTGSIVIAVILLLRLLLRRAPKKYICLLWLLAAVRLLLPFRIESSLSLQPDFTQSVQLQATQSAPVLPQTPVTTGPTQNQTPTITAPAVTPGTSAPAASTPVTETPVTVEASKQADPATILVWVWACAAISLLSYGAIRYLQLRSKVSDAVILSEGVWVTKLNTAMVLGFVRPKIYLNAHLDDQQRHFVLRHEQSHIRRGDHLWKPLGFFTLAIHWFNPLVWLGYILLCRDLEMACDEAVIRDLDLTQRKSYSAALLSCSAHRHAIAACPVAFGEVSVKERIKNVLNYKKPAFWIILITVVAIILVAVCFLTNPADQQSEDPVLASFYNAMRQLQASEGYHVVYEYAVETEFPYLLGHTVETWYCNGKWYIARENRFTDGKTYYDYMNADGITYWKGWSDDIEGVDMAWEVREYYTFTSLLDKDWTTLEVKEITTEETDNGRIYTIVLLTGETGDVSEPVYESYYTFRMDENANILSIHLYLHGNRYMRGNGRAGYWETKYDVTITVQAMDPAILDAKIAAAMAEMNGSDTQLQTIHALFSDPHGWYNAALTSEYTEATQLNLKMFFHLGFSDQSRTPTAEEWAELEGQPGFNENYDLIRLPADNMDAVLTQYFGITLEDMDESAFEGLVYLESTDCYYFMGTGVHRIEDLCIERTTEQDDGTILVIYTSSYCSGIVTLEMRNDGDYRILSNEYT